MALTVVLAAYHSHALDLLHFWFYCYLFNIYITLGPCRTSVFVLGCSGQGTNTSHRACTKMGPQNGEQPKEVGESNISHADYF